MPYTNLTVATPQLRFPLPRHVKLTTLVNHHNRLYICHSQRQGDLCEFRARLVYIVRPYHK